MKILILGGAGMLGHKIYEAFKKEKNIRIFISLREANLSKYPQNFFAKKDCIFSCNVLAFKDFAEKIKALKPDILINCIGITKALVKDPIETIEINSLFPHKLAQLCRQLGTKLIHISTDCVFSGKKGNYSLKDIPSPVDLYGKSKLLGEVAYGNNLTIRTSIVGRELNSKNGLLEWFLAQKGEVRGFKNAIFTGLTTSTFAYVLLKIIKNFPKLSGVIHVAGDKINKYDLLLLFKDKFKVKVKILEDNSFICDRSLIPDKIFKDKIKIPSMKEMIVTL